MAILIGMIIGLALGLTGSGGSILAVPLFVIFLHMEPMQAIGLSLGVVAISSISGVIGHLPSRNIQWLPAMIFAVVGSAFTPLGHLIGKQLAPSVIMTCFCSLIAIVAYLMWKKSNATFNKISVIHAGACSHSPSAELSQISRQQPFKLDISSISWMSCGAIFAGTLSGLFGVGGGFILIPTLMYSLSINIQQAIATSLLIISVISSTGFIHYALSGAVSFEFNLLIEIIIGGIAGMAIGLLLGKKLSGPKLQKLFSVASVALALLLLYRQFT